MPGFDRTGPRGMGSMKGGGRGCCGNPDRTRDQLAAGQGFLGRCVRRGWRNMFRAEGLSRWQRWAFRDSPATVEDEKQTLKSEADFLKSKLQTLEKRLAAMQGEDK